MGNGTDTKVMGHNLGNGTDAVGNGTDTVGNRTHSEGNGTDIR